MKRFILALLLLVSFSGAINASTLTVWTVQGLRFTTPQLACKAYSSAAQAVQDMGYYWKCHLGPTAAYTWVGNTIRAIYDCPYGHTGTECNATLPTCPTGTFDPVANSCPTAPVNPCTDKKDQSTPFIQKWPSVDAYKASCSGSVNGCAVDTCSGGASQCGTNGKTGEFACWGTAKYSGEQATGSEQAGETPAPPIPESTTTGQNQSCTAPAVNSGTTTYTCLTESNATEFASSNCAVGTVNGVQGLHCTKPDYVPEHDSKKREDQVTEVTNPDGSKTTTTTSTTTTTHCAAGACTTTTNVTTTTSGKDANGNPTGTTTTCKGDNCDNPTTPGKDESEEEEDEEEGTATPFVPGDKGDYLPEIGGGDEAPTYAESLDDFTDRVSNAPIVRGLTSITVPSGGSCSMGSAQLFGGSVSFNDFCTMAPQVLAGLRYLFLAIWAWAAIRLFFTA